MEEKEMNKHTDGFKHAPTYEEFIELEKIVGALDSRVRYLEEHRLSDRELDEMRKKNK